MGIKGIYGEIGPGERISLSKLAIEKLEKEGRPLRVAIDVSIWQFQTLAGQGGSNPAIRTFYYRLLRLLSFSVQPLFVFDGPHKPPFKRGKKTGQHGACVPNFMTKQMLNLFGFPFHMAPGEAEAECALLQREGLVDAVLSEDVDTLMFGCDLTLRNWSSEGTRGNKSPTHVSVYAAKVTKEGKSGLDREGMVLVALMSGGDYITEGIPHCGIKVACEAARAGFGKSLCELANNDVAGIAAWRDNLAHEIKTNKNKFFRVKHKSLIIPENFPNREVLGYYTNPVVSSGAKVQKLKDQIVWDGEINIQKLRQFVAEAFDWTNKIGARKFIRNLAPALLVYKLRVRGNRRDSSYGDLVLTAMNEMELVRAICGNRNHFSVDGIKELRVVYSPIDIVGIDLDAEHDDSVDYSRSGLATNDADDQDLEVSDEDTPKSPSKRGPSMYDPTQPDKLWLPETIAKLGVPLKVQDYEESLRNPREFITARATAKRAAAKKKIPTGTMDKFVSVTKPSKENVTSGASKVPSKSATVVPGLPPTYLAPGLEHLNSSQFQPSTLSNKGAKSTRKSADLKTTNSASTRAKNRGKATTKPQPNINPWTIAQEANTSIQNCPNVTKKTIACPSSSPLAFKAPSPIYFPSSPPSVRSTSPQPPNHSSGPRISAGKHRHSPAPSPTPSPNISDHESELDLPDTVTISRSRSRRNQTKISVPSTPRKSRNPEHSSPRKKISPDHPTSIHSARSDRKGVIEGKGPEPVARIIDFSATARSASSVKSSTGESDRDRSSSPELPTLDELHCSASVSMQSSRPTTAKDSPGPTTPQEVFGNEFSLPLEDEQENLEVVKDRTVKPKKYIMPRKSLAGAWKEVDEDDIIDVVMKKSSKGRDMTPIRKWRLEEVEMVDMTAD